MKKNNFVVVVVCFFLVISLVGNVYFVSKMNESAQGETPPSENPENAEVDMTQENADRYSDEIDIIELDDANSRDTYFSIHNIRQAHELSKGAGVKVGILDWCFGYSEHEDLYAGGKDFLENPDTFSTWSQHGYWMALVLKEIAPECEIYALNTHTENDEEMRMDALIDAIDWAIENNIDILTLSQRPIESEYMELFDQAVERANENGIVTTFIHCCNPQNILPFGIATYNDGMYTREPDVRIFQYDYNRIFLDEYFYYTDGEKSYPYSWSVSSMSPVTAGFIAILKSINNELTPEDYKEILIATSYGTNYDGPVESDNGYCSNIVDIGKAAEFIESNY